MDNNFDSQTHDSEQMNSTVKERENNQAETTNDLKFTQNENDDNEEDNDEDIEVEDIIQSYDNFI